MLHAQDVVCTTRVAVRCGAAAAGEGKVWGHDELVVRGCAVDCGTEVGHQRGDREETAGRGGGGGEGREGEGEGGRGGQRGEGRQEEEAQQLEDDHDEAAHQGGATGATGATGARRGGPSTAGGGEK